MPEISFCLFDLKQLLKLFIFEDRDFVKKIDDYEEKMQDEMAQNRAKLFAE